MEYTAQAKASYEKPEPTNFTIITESTRTSYLSFARHPNVLQEMCVRIILFGNCDTRNPYVCFKLFLSIRSVIKERVLKNYFLV